METNAIITAMATKLANSLKVSYEELLKTGVSIQQLFPSEWKAIYKEACKMNHISQLTVFEDENGEADVNVNGVLACLYQEMKDCKIIF